MKRNLVEDSIMPKLLSSDDIKRFRDEGFLSPIRVMSEAEAAEMRKRLEEFEGRTGGPLRGDLRHKAHLLFPWLANLVRNEKDPGRGRGSLRTGFAVLDLEFLHQGGAESGVRVMASGFDLLGTERAGCCDRLGRADAEQRIQRRDASDARYPHHGSDPASRYVR